MRKIGFLILAGALLLGAAVVMNTDQMFYRFPATGATARKVTLRLNDILPVTNFCTSGGAGEDDTTCVSNACAAAVAAGKTLMFPSGTYLITGNVTCGANMELRGLAQISVAIGMTFTANGHVSALTTDPFVGLGAVTYGKDINFFVNDFGFGVGRVASSNTDDFIHFQRDVNQNTGILVKNLNTGALVDAFIHLWAGPISGGTQGSDIRISANSQAAGRLVNIVAGNATAFSLISNSTTGTVDMYAGNVRQTSVEPVTTAVNYLAMKGGAAGSGPSVYPRGTDANVNLTIGAQGTGSILFRTNINTSPAFQFEVRDVPSSTAWVQVKGSNGGSPAITTSSLAPVNIAVPITITAVTNATLGTPVNGTIAYCSDCTIANPCAGAGTGAFAKRLNGVWVCN